MYRISTDQKAIIIIFKQIIKENDKMNISETPINDIQMDGMQALKNKFFSILNSQMSKTEEMTQPLNYKLLTELKFMQMET